ncbi:MAG: C4-dicarboxylate ABC transporter permease [Pseudomonadota bacterium]
MLDAIGVVLATIGNALYGVFWVITHPVQAFNFSDTEAIMRLIFYGASGELLALVILVALGVFIAGMFRREFLWGVVLTIEGISNGVGRFAAWAGLIMVLQQIMVIFLQAIFRVSEISVSPVGLDFTKNLGWYGDGLKFYNGAVVCLCCAYTFVQRGHVRVDLFYASWGHRTKRIMDMLGTVFMMLPALSIMWLYGWFFMWRSLAIPPVNATDTLDRLVLKARAFRWNVETISSSPSGFDAYFLFKVLLVVFCFTMILQAIGFFYRSFLELREEETERGLDLDVLDPHDGVATEGGH